jgi:hypothetical protein
MNYYKLVGDKVFLSESAPIRSSCQILDTSLTAFGFTLRISTIFLGLDCGLNLHDDDDYVPTLFETMVFCDEIPSTELYFQDRYQDYYSAIKGHCETIKSVMVFIQGHAEKLKKTEDEISRNPMFNAIIKRLNQGRKFTIHECVMCNFKCHYLMKDKQLFYNSGCDCVTYTAIRIRNISDIQEYLDLNPTFDFLDEKYWNE